MAYSAIAIANAFIERGIRGEIPDLTPMKIQKLLFYTQSWHLRNNNGRKLFADDFERWPYGPVIPSIYHELKTYRFNTVGNKISRLIQCSDGQKIVIPYVNSEDNSSRELIDKISITYGKLSGPKLSEMTHAKGSAWDRCEYEGEVISVDNMARYIHPE